MEIFQKLLFRTHDKSLLFSFVLTFLHFGKKFNFFLEILKLNFLFYFYQNLISCEDKRHKIVDKLSALSTTLSDNKSCLFFNFFFYSKKKSQTRITLNL